MERKWWIILIAVLLLYYMGHRDTGNTNQVKLTKSSDNWYSDRWWAKQAAKSADYAASGAYHYGSSGSSDWDQTVANRNYEAQKKKFDYRQELYENSFANYAVKQAARSV